MVEERLGEERRARSEERRARREERGEKSEERRAFERGGSPGVALILSASFGVFRGQSLP
jgi:hypothetical protein